MRTRYLLLPLGIAVVVAALPGLAGAAAWRASGTGLVQGAADTLGTPASASAAATAGSTSTSITVTWTAPATGPAPTSYRVQRVSPAGAAGTVTCATGSTTLTCIDNGRTPSTTYSYDVYAVVTNWDGTAKSGATAATASGDTTAPVVTANCPTNGTTYSNASNNGNGTWNKACTAGVAITATDAVGVTSAAAKVTKGTLCWNGINDLSTGFTTAACTAAGPSGYPAGYVALTSGAGNSWTRTLAGPSLSAGPWTLEALAMDAVGNTATKLTVSFTIN